MLMRLEEYKAMKAKAHLYTQVLDMRQQEILTNLDGLQETARKLLEVATETDDVQEEDRHPVPPAQPIEQAPV